jgi:hypothetical protein
VPLRHQPGPERGAAVERQPFEKLAREPPGETLQDVRASLGKAGLDSVRDFAGID